MAPGIVKTIVAVFRRRKTDHGPKITHFDAIDTASCVGSTLSSSSGDSGISGMSWFSENRYESTEDLSSNRPKESANSLDNLAEEVVTMDFGVETSDGESTDAQSSERPGSSLLETDSRSKSVLPNKAIQDWSGALTCPVCREVFADPRILSCGHTFCLLCLELIRKARKEVYILRNVIICPMCRLETNLPDDQVRRLQINLALRNLTETLSLHSPKRNSANIDGSDTSSSEEIAVAETYEKFELHKVQSIDVKNCDPVTGVALHKKTVYFTCSWSNILGCIDLKSHKRAKEIVIENMTFPVDIATSDVLDSLFIVDEHENRNCIWKYNLTTHRLTEWLSGMVQPYAIHISPHTGSLLRLSSNSVFSYLYVHGTDKHKEQLLQKIKLPDIIKYPHHAIHSSDGNFIICYASRLVGVENWSGWNVSVVSTEGSLIQTFLSTPLDGPLYCIASDGNDGVFVTEGTHKSVLRLGIRTGTVQRFFDARSCKSNLQPWKIYSSANKKLLIVGYTEGFMDIYKT